MSSKNSDPLLHRIPPHDLDVETSLLSALFISNRMLFEVQHIVTSEDFYKGAHQKIFQAIVELSARQEPADLVTVANLLKEKNELDAVGGAAYLASIADHAPVAVNAEHYARIIRGKSSLRQMIDTASRVIERCLEERLKERLSDKI